MRATSRSPRTSSWTSSRKWTTGFTGADLENLLNEAALLAARRNRKDISMKEVEEAVDRVMVGMEKKSRIISDREKRIVAFHEAGHTIIGYFLENADMVQKVTIIPRGRAGGYVMMLPKEDRHAGDEAGTAGEGDRASGGRVSRRAVHRRNRHRRLRRFQERRPASCAA